MMSGMVEVPSFITASAWLSRISSGRVPAYVVEFLRQDASMTSVIAALVASIGTSLPLLIEMLLEKSAAADKSRSSSSSSSSTRKRVLLLDVRVRMLLSVLNLLTSIALLYAYTAQTAHIDLFLCVSFSSQVFGYLLVLCLLGLKVASILRSFWTRLALFVSLFLAVFVVCVASTQMTRSHIYACFTMSILTLCAIASAARLELLRAFTSTSSLSSTPHIEISRAKEAMDSMWHLVLVIAAVLLVFLLPTATAASSLLTNAFTTTSADKQEDKLLAISDITFIIACSSFFVVCACLAPSRKPPSFKGSAATSRSPGKGAALFDLNGDVDSDSGSSSSSNRRMSREKMMALRLLHSMVPPKIAYDLANGNEVVPQMYDFAVIFFSDIKGFTDFAAIHTSLDVFAMLERVFTVMDFCCSLFPSLYKVETAGDSYMVVGGLNDFATDEDDDEEGSGEPTENGNTSGGQKQEMMSEKKKMLLKMLQSSSYLRLLKESGSPQDAKNIIVVNAICQFALLVRDSVQKIWMDESSFVQIRIGLHCGSITTGVSGRLTPKFCVFGDSVNTAARMEQTGRTDKVHISATLRSFMKHVPYMREQYEFEKRSPIEIKGKGTMHTYFLEPTHMRKFRSKFAKEIEHIDVLTQRNCESKFVMSRGKVSLSHLPSAALTGAAGGGGGVGGGEEGGGGIESTPRALEAARKTGESSRFELWEDFMVWSEVDDGHNISSLKESSLPAPDLNDYLLRNMQREFDVGANSTGSLTDESSSQNASAFTFEVLISDDFSILSIDPEDFSTIFALILVLCEGVVGSLQDVDVEETVLRRFIRKIGTTYRENSYHNFHHAFCVTRETAVFICRLGLASAGYTKKELFVVLIAALVHDVDHPGTNNEFEMKSSSRLALLYNDSSVLEMHHLALTFNILHMPEYNIFELWWDEERLEARKIITQVVLSTDMTLHNGLQLDLQDRSAKQPSFQLSKMEERIELAKHVVHAADIFNAARPSSINQVIAKQIFVEFKHQTTKERALGLPVTPYMNIDSDVKAYKGEVGFTAHVARPFFVAFAACFPDVPQVNFEANIVANIDFWQKQLTISTRGSLKGASPA